LENPGVDGNNIKMAPSEAASDDVLAICETQHSLKWQDVVNKAMNLKGCVKTG
jgi:hypothetical protein